jgi:hypothetical protein
MECTSCRLNNFRVIEVFDAQKDRHLKTGRSVIELKHDANLSFLLASPGSLDACHLDLKFVHQLAGVYGPAARLAPIVLGLCFAMSLIGRGAGASALCSSGSIVAALAFLMP